MFSSALPISLLLSTVAAQTQFAGVNIAGFDFGCGTDGSDNVTNATPPLASIQGNPDGQGQIAHFVEDDGLNLFRLPVGWQYLVNNNVGGTLDAQNFATYDTLVQSCLSTGSHCIIDIHNYARWDGEIIGQGGPTNDEFASVWSQIATKYADESNIIFGIMNEPHDIPDITLWAETVQAAVTAIRTAGATTQMILLPGNDWTGAQTFVSNGSGAALSAVKNLDGTNTSLIFDVHKYLDSDGSGTHTDCTADHVSDTFEPLATWLREQGRQAMLTETGGGNTATCLTDVCTELAYLNANNDVYLGYTGWAAGAFALTYELVERPTGSNGSWVDQEIVTQCIVGTRSNATSTSPTTTVASNSTTSTFFNGTSENAAVDQKASEKLGYKIPAAMHGAKGSSGKSRRRATRRFSH